MIIETTSNQLYAVAETDNPDLAHVWCGIPVRKVRDEYIPTARGRSLQYRNSPELVRKAGARVVEA